jgi:hypothetical protein
MLRNIDSDWDFALNSELISDCRTICMLLFNFINYVFLLLCLYILIVKLIYSYCFVYYTLCILIHCVVLCIVYV